MRHGKYHREPCKYCGKVVASWGPGWSNHANKCEGAGKEKRQNERRMETLIKVRGPRTRRSRTRKPD